MSHAFTRALLLCNVFYCLVYATSLYLKTLSLVYLNRNSCWYNKCSKRTLIKLTVFIRFEVLPHLGWVLLHNYVLCRNMTGYLPFSLYTISSVIIRHAFKLICLTTLVNLLYPHPKIKHSYTCKRNISRLVIVTTPEKVIIIAIDSSYLYAHVRIQNFPKNNQITQ